MNTNSYSDDLKAIRKIMEESSRFLSLNGLSGVFAGVFALIGYAVAAYLTGEKTNLPESALKLYLFIDAMLVLTAALGVSVLLALRKAARRETPLWNPTTRRMLVNLAIPLISGAIMILVFYLNADYGYIIPAMLVFYGLALVSAGKFTFGEIQYLGGFQVLTGLFAAFFPEYGFVSWAFGFGILHILYGVIMHRKYR